MSEASSIKLVNGLKDRLRAIAESRQRSVNGLMNDVLLEFADRAERRATFLREAQEAHREYRETGLHVTREEMDTWFDAVARGEDPPLPEPHT
jgi:predicted transcriptional regulator